ncbi:GntR family transcriptional regulator [Paenibacillus montaniterrae]|uniref:GntR family transcriptional regulator n=1 Tax=Paenibacillus montaniterrae TaxID=429341 RepID=A0A920D0D5_9BACL|nr:GntR family transcriptional regulator [Paenibacillus montaniterrae]GIP19460.1 GntR family transcriptional regulator [Paenibacillus montaniterrae]
MEASQLLLDEKKKSESIKDYLYRVIRKNIIYNRLHPGDAVSENVLASVFQVSRTPIREAINKLVVDELLEVYPQRGTNVSYIDMRRVREAVFMRETLEMGAIKLACETFGEEQIFRLESNLNQQIFCYERDKLMEVMELDNQLHQIIFEECQLLRVWQAMQGIGSDQYRIRYLKLYNRLRWEETIEEHKTIIANIKDKNVSKAVADIQSHINKLYDDARIIQQQMPEYFLHA